MDRFRADRRGGGRPEVWNSRFPGPRGDDRRLPRWPGFGERPEAVFAGGQARLEEHGFGNWLFNTNANFIQHAFRDRGPKVLTGFSRPVYHNVAGLLFGHQFGKKDYGGMIRHTEGAMLYKWASQLPPEATIVEIGCYGGLSTSYLASGSRRNRARIVAIDPFDSDLEKQTLLTDSCVSLRNKPSRSQVQERLQNSGFADRVELIEGYSQDVVRTWNRPIHFLWIDGNHDQAYQDYLDWSGFLVPGARVAIHDAHPRYGIGKVAEDARRIFSSDEWTRLEHVKGILTAVRRSWLAGACIPYNPTLPDAGAL